MNSIEILKIYKIFKKIYNMLEYTKKNIIFYLIIQI